jgi:hypothetical protein
MEKTAAPESRVVRLFSTFKMVFPSFPMRILVSSNMLFTNRKNLVVDEVAPFKKALAFWKLMVRIGKTLLAKMVCRIAVVGNFLALFVFVVFPALVDLAPDVRFRKI